MLTFKKFLISEETNAHMAHLEDNIILGGVKGAREVIFALKAMRDMLSGSATNENKITTKWDGAPAVFAGIDPSDGQFFVAKKGIFRKDPEVYKSVEDIKEKVKGGDLQNKLIVAYTELKKLNIKGVIQGDIMFTGDDVKKEVINKQEFITFHPNTILYAVPSKSKLAKRILKANIGVVWHTVYTGDTLETMRATYGFDASKLAKSESSWNISADVEDLSGTVSMTASETADVDKSISAAGKLFQKISGSFLRKLEKNEDMQIQLMTYVNTFIRKGTMPSAAALATGAKQFMLDKLDVKIAKLKTDRTKAVWIAKKDVIEDFFGKEQSQVAAMFDMYIHVFNSKNLIINKLNNLNLLDTFVKTKNGFKVTGQEGFVIVDKLADKAFKIVDRLEFSTNNFSPDIVKGWDSPSRG